MMPLRPGASAIVLAAMSLLMPGVAAAQPDAQLWGAIALNWIKNDHVTVGVDIEPKVLVSAPADEPEWATLDATPSVEYSHGPWIDVLGELKLGRTRQTDDLDSTEITPRVGVRFHVLSHLRDLIDNERQPLRRVALRNLLRFEWRNFFYSTGQPDQSTSRLRDRVEVLVAVNRPRISEDGAIYMLSDMEWFWPRGEPAERFANKQRIRGGIGYRHNRAWRFETLYVWDRARDSADEGFTAVDHALDLRVKRVW